MKYYKKIVFLIIISLLVSGVLASCKSSDNAKKNPNYVPDTLPTEIKQEIQRAHFEKTYDERGKEYYNSPDQVELIHYGSFGDAYCVMLFDPNTEYADVMRTEEIAGSTFYYNNGNSLSVYYKGVFYSVRQAFENKILDKAEVYNLCSYYSKAKWGNN